MDDIQLILYIVFLVGYFIFKMVTGKRKPITREDTEQFDQHSDHHEYEPHDHPMRGPKTFEEILEELTGGGRSIEKEQDISKTTAEVPESSWYDNPEEVHPLRVIETPKYLTIDQQIDLDDLDSGIGEVEDIEEAEMDNKLAKNPYLALFSNLEGAKQAIVMNEIINRKY